MSIFGSPKPGSARNDTYHGQRWQALGFRVLEEFNVGTQTWSQAAGAAEAGAALVVCRDEGLCSVSLSKFTSEELDLKKDSKFLVHGDAISPGSCSQAGEQGLAAVTHLGLLPAHRFGVSVYQPKYALESEQCLWAWRLTNISETTC